jgi:hypothetical protein
MNRPSRRAGPPLALLSGALLLSLGCNVTVGPPAAPPLGKADFTLTAKDLAQEFKKDDKATTARYADKVLEVTGVLIALHPASRGEFVLVLEGEPNSIVNVFCATKVSKPWDKATPRQTVKVKGKFPPHPNSAALIDCTIEEATGEPAPTVAAADLAREFAADQDAARKKYDAKVVILTGEVDAGQSDKSAVKLKAGLPRGVICYMAPDAPRDAQGLKPGQPVKLLATFSGGSRDQVQFFNCLLID